jgi:RNA polymerase II subunit A-like phosphatase
MSPSSSQLFLPPGTPFPLNVVKIQTKASDSVQRGTPLLTYSFASRPSEPGGRARVLFGTWDCPVEGTIERWCVKERDVITSDDKVMLYISEPCKHGVQMGGLCALCGKDMTECVYFHGICMSMFTDNRSDYTGFSDEARASIQMTHSANGPKVSLEEAQRIEQETAEHLFSTRKLSLIVDLDQTIVHATVDPTVGDWIAEGEAWEARQTRKRVSSEAESDSDESSEDEDDEVNPNWEALKDVKKFRLRPESFGLPPGPDKRRIKGKENMVETQGCLYYVKPRYVPSSCVILVLTSVALKSRMA